MSPWVHRGLAVGMLAAGLWLAGSLSHAPAAEATPLTVPQPHVATATGGTPASPHAGPVSWPEAVSGTSGQLTPAGAASPITVSSQRGIPSALARTGGTVSAIGHGAIRQARSAVISTATGGAPSLPAVPTVPAPVLTVPVPAVATVPVPVLTVPVPAVPTLPAPVLTVPVPAVPGVPVPVLVVPPLPVPALPVVPPLPVPALPVVPAPAEAAHSGTATQPATGAAVPPAEFTTDRNHNPVSSVPRNSSAARSTQRWARPAGTTPAAPPLTPPAGHRPGIVPALGVGISGNNPLDSGLVLPNLCSTGTKSSWGSHGHGATPPRKRATAPPVSPD
jgi:hypothetical protein